MDCELLPRAGWWKLSLLRQTYMNGTSPVLMMTAKGQQANRDKHEA